MRGFLGAWNHHLLPPQRDLGLPMTLPKEQSGAWTAEQKLALELELASGSVGPGLPQSPVPTREHHPLVTVTAPWTNQSTITFSVPLPRLAAPFCNEEIPRFKGLYKVTL